jgi:predicted TIM-barrel fold metal-dependent hydrolase
VLPERPIIDGHHHIGLKPGLGEFSGADLVRKMDREGVARSVVMHFVSPLRSQDDFARANAYVAEHVDRHPDRLAGAVAVDPRNGDAALEQIDDYRRAGFRAVKLQPILHGNYAVDGGVVDEVAMLAGQLKMPVVIHCDLASSVCSPWVIHALARRFPETTFVLLHLGLHPDAPRRVPAIVRDAPNIVVDTSQTPDIPEAVYSEPVRILGAERVLFGSDGPECDLSLNLRKLDLAIEQYGLAEQDAALVLGGNAERIFSL